MNTETSQILTIQVRNLRRTSEVFTSTKLANEEQFSAIMSALEEKGFKITKGRYEYTETVSLTVVGLKSDRAVAYAIDLIKRAGGKVGFTFPFSISHV